MTHARLRTTTVAGLAGCLLLAACSSTTPKAGSTSAAQVQSGAATTSAGAPASAVDHSTTAAASAVHPSAACSLVTEADVTSSVASDPGKGTAATSNVGATGCTYGSYPEQVLTVNVLDSQGRAAYDHARHDPRLASTGGLGVVNVAGVGDQAFELRGPHTDAIYFTKGDALIVIGFSAPTAPTKGAALVLAKVAASRL